MMTGRTVQLEFMVPECRTGSLGDQGELPERIMRMGGTATLLTFVALTVALAHAQSAPQGPIRVSGGVMAGHILTRVWPLLPQEARENHVNGAVVMHAIIGKDGHIKSLAVISGPEMLRAAFLDAVRQWTYKPYLVDGEPVEVETTITITSNFGG